VRNAHQQYLNDKKKKPLHVVVGRAKLIALMALSPLLDQVLFIAENDKRILARVFEKARLMPFVTQ
jgi:hypothetical protein